MTSVYAGGGDFPEQQQIAIQRQPESDPVRAVLDTLISAVGPGTVLLAIVIGLAVIWKKKLKQWIS